MNRKLVLICFVCITTFSRILSFELGHLHHVVADEFNKTEEIILDNAVLEVDSSTIVSTPDVSDQPDLHLVGLKTEVPINRDPTGEDLESHSYDESTSSVGRSKRQDIPYASQYGYVLYDPEYDHTRCPPFEETCPLHGIPVDLCNYQIVMKVLILDHPRLDDKERICGKLGKLAALRDISETRTIFAFSVKDSCGCPLQENQHYFVFSKVQALSKQGALYSQISLSDNTALLPFNSYVEKNIMERLRSCPSSGYKPLDYSYSRNTYSFQVTSKPVHIKPITYSTPAPVSYSSTPQPYVWPQPSPTYKPISVPKPPQPYTPRPNTYAPLPVICFPQEVNNPLPAPSKYSPFTQNHTPPPPPNYPLSPPPTIDVTYPPPKYVSTPSPTYAPPPPPSNYELSPLNYVSQPLPNYAPQPSPNNVQPPLPFYEHPLPPNYDPQPPIYANLSPSNAPLPSPNALAPQPAYIPRPPPKFVHQSSPNAPTPTSKDTYELKPSYISQPSNYGYQTAQVYAPSAQSYEAASELNYAASKPAILSSAIPEAYKSQAQLDYAPLPQQQANPPKPIQYAQSNPPRTLYEAILNYQNPPARKLDYIPSPQHYNTSPPEKYKPQNPAPLPLPVEEAYSSSYPVAYDSSQQQYVAPAKPQYDPIPFEKYPQSPRSSSEATLGQQYTSTQESVSVIPQQWNPAPAPPYVPPPPPSNYGR